MSPIRGEWLPPHKSIRLFYFFIFNLFRGCKAPVTNLKVPRPAPRQENRDVVWKEEQSFFIWLSCAGFLALIIVTFVFIFLSVQKVGGDSLAPWNWAVIPRSALSGGY